MKTVRIDNGSAARGKIETAEGFTLVELLIAMVVSMFVVTAAYNVFILQSRHFSIEELKAEMLQNARAGLDVMAREILMAGYNPGGTIAACTGTTNATTTPCVGITSVSASAISFTADLNGDGDLADSNENITYDVYSSGGKSCLGRTSNGSRQPAVENISVLSFTYLDGSNVATTNLAIIKKIRISVTAITSRTDVTPITLSMDIVPRNLNN